jgi:hypothetical protein
MQEYPVFEVAGSSGMVNNTNYNTLLLVGNIIWGSV